MCSSDLAEEMEELPKVVLNVANTEVLKAGDLKTSAAAFITSRLPGLFFWLMDLTTPPWFSARLR